MLASRPMARLQVLDGTQHILEHVAVSVGGDDVAEVGEPLDVRYTVTQDTRQGPHQHL